MWDAIQLPRWNLLSAGFELEMTRERSYRLIPSWPIRSHCADDCLLGRTVVAGSDIAVRRSSLAEIGGVFVTKECTCPCWLEMLSIRPRGVWNSVRRGDITSFCGAIES